MELTASVRQDCERKAQNHKPLTAQELIDMFLDQDGFCYWCGDDISLGYWELDHIHPRAKGGSNTIDNVCASCYRCNREKSDMHPARWRACIPQTSAMVVTIKW